MENWASLDEYRFLDGSIELARVAIKLMQQLVPGYL
jgi:hypothetical protein